jgi:hypothetical protein
MISGATQIFFPGKKKAGLENEPRNLQVLDAIGKLLR